MNQFDAADTVRYYYTPIGFLAWSSETGEALAKIDGIAWDSTLFTAPRGTWDTGDARLRVPWRLLGGMIDPSAVDAVREAWLAYQTDTIRIGRMPVWRLECRMVQGAKGTSRARVVGVEVMDGFWVCFGGPARQGAAFGQLDLATGEVVLAHGEVDQGAAGVDQGAAGVDQEAQDYPDSGNSWDGDAV